MLPPKAVDDRWAGWVSASVTHNWVIGDPIADYLNEFGRQAGFEPDHDMISYDRRFDYVSFVLKQSWAFERKVVQWLSTRFPVRVILTNPAQARLPEKVEATIAAMNDRVALIAQGVRSGSSSPLQPLPSCGRTSRRMKISNGTQRSR